MPNYATQPDLEAYFGAAELLIAADRDNTGAVDPGVVGTGLKAATEEMDSYLGVRYDLPLESVPGVLTRVCCDLAMYHMSVNSPSMTEHKQTRYDAGIKWLKAIAAGEATLGEEEDEETVQDEPEITLSASDRLFTRSKMGGLL